MNGLKNCPFCGGKAEMGVLTNNLIGWQPEGYLPRCKDVNCPGHLELLFKTKEEAVAVWNRRAGEEPEEPVHREYGRPDPTWCGIE